MSKLFWLADDDYDDAEIFSEALSETGETIEFVHLDDCNTLLNTLNQPGNNKPDVIFLDLNMPGMSGWDCLSNLQKLADCKNIPVIMYTTSSNPVDRDKAYTFGATGFITKPSSYRTLIGILKSIAQAEMEHLKDVVKSLTSK